jgi:outer membrane protein OmpA-like peptidoglycan-associated protein
MAVLGCAALPCREPLAVRVVTRDRGEPIIVEQVFIVADVSTSMRSTDKFPVEKSLVRSFVAAMPDGDYGAAIIDFGGRIDPKWYRDRCRWPCGAFRCACRCVPAKATACLSQELAQLEPFDRDAMMDGASALARRGGRTPLGRALLRIQDDLTGASGRTSIVLFSDGRASNEKGAAKQCQKLVDCYDDEVCIYTVQIGTDPRGGDFLCKLAAMSDEDCGSFRTANELSTASDVEDFVREVMLGPPPPPKPEPPKPPAPKPEPPKVIDSDGDGVPDDRDHCPNSPPGVPVNERGCWIIPGLNFDTDKHDIKPEYHKQLDEVVEILLRNPEIDVRVDGHTDSAGTGAHNQGLSERRATAVMEYLIEKGIDESRLRAVGYGESRPVRPNDSAENMAVNRRVELTTHLYEE